MTNKQSKQKQKQKTGGHPGIEPGTSSTLRKNHTTRPIALIFYCWTSWWRKLICVCRKKERQGKKTKKTSNNNREEKAKKKKEHIYEKHS